MAARTVVFPRGTTDPAMPGTWLQMSGPRWRLLADEVAIDGVTSRVPFIYETDGTGRVFRRLSESRWRLLEDGEEPESEVGQSHGCHFVEVGDGEWTAVHDTYVNMATSGRMRVTDELDERLMVAMSVAARYRMEAFSVMLLEHERHPSFRPQGWAFTREVGFTCECSGQEREWRIGLSKISDLLPEARERLVTMHGMRDPRNYRGFNRFNPRTYRPTKRAERRARALLHRHLTREQRWELRGSKAFTVIGQDGREYLVTEGTCNNVYLLEGGEKRFRLCVVDSGMKVPVHDLMLAQKLMIEGDISSYLGLAHATNVRTGYHFDGRILLKDLPSDEEQTRPESPPVTRRDVEDPVGWARRLFRRIEEERNADGRDAGDGDGRDVRPGPGRGFQALLEQVRAGGGEDREEGLQAV
jgi:hypothetical protein